MRQLAAIALWAVISLQLRPLVAQAAPEVSLDVLYYGQTMDYPWGGDFIGGSRALLADNGCIITCLAMVLRYYGQDLDPRATDRGLLLAGAYDDFSQAGERLGKMSFRYELAAKAFPALGRLRMRGKLRTQADVEELKSELRQGRPIIATVRLMGSYNHAVLLYGFRDGDFLVHDPMDEQNTSLSRYASNSGNPPGTRGLDCVIGTAVYAKAEGQALSTARPSGTEGSPEPPQLGAQNPIPDIDALAKAARPNPMRAVSGGRFRMGAKDSHSYLVEEDVHWVELADFELAERECSVGEFASFVAATGYRSQAEIAGWAWVMEDGLLVRRRGASWRRPGYPIGPDKALSCVSWRDAAAYCDYLNAQAGISPVYAAALSQGRGAQATHPRLSPGAYRLPSEAEWEYAARGGLGAKPGEYPGRARLSELGWYVENSGNMAQDCAQKLANALGLYDMAGNVWEWCDDGYSSYYYRVSPTQDPRGPEVGGCRVARGGSWANRWRNLRVSQRYARPESEAYSYLGFRVARSLASPKGGVGR